MNGEDVNLFDRPDWCGNTGCCWGEKSDCNKVGKRERKKRNLLSWQRSDQKGRKELAHFYQQASCYIILAVVLFN